MDQAEIERVAKRLTKAQWEALDGAFVVQGQATWRNGRLAVRAHGKVLWNLRRARLTTDYIGTPMLTEDGLSVRRYLEDQPHDQ